MSKFLARQGLPALAYLKTEAAQVTQPIGIVYVGGFMSSKSGSKVTVLRRLFEQRGHHVLSFDYTDKGESIDKTQPARWSFEQWHQDALTAFDTLTTGPQIVVGSSMGAWMSLLVARARPERVLGLVTIAAAVGFTDKLPPFITDDLRAAYEANEIVQIVDGKGSMPVSKRLIEEGGRLNLLSGDQPIQVNCPVRCCHSIGDVTAPYKYSVDVVRRVSTPDAQVVLRQGGDHLMQSNEEMHIIIGAINELLLKNKNKL